MKKLGVVAAFVILGLGMIPAQASAGSAEFEWDGRYRTSCRPEAWRQPADWPDPKSYRVIRTFNTASKVTMVSRGSRYDMGEPARRISGDGNASARWHWEHHLKASVQTEWGLVKRYVGSAREEYRYANFWTVYRCRGVRISP